MKKHADECWLGMLHQQAACKCTFLKHVAIALLNTSKKRAFTCSVAMAHKCIILPTCPLPP